MCLNLDSLRELHQWHQEKSTLLFGVVRYTSAGFCCAGTCASSGNINIHSKYCMQHVDNTPHATQTGAKRPTRIKQGNRRHRWLLMKAGSARGKWCRRDSPQEKETEICCRWRPWARRPSEPLRRDRPAAVWSWFWISFCGLPLLPTHRRRRTGTSWWQEVIKH